MAKDLKIALVGNPNTGKSTLFNLLTGLNQKIGNFPGITVDKKVGYCKLPDGRNAEITDLPGTYSLYPKSKDESIVFQVLADKNNSSYPDIVVLVADATNLRRNLLLYSQVADLQVPVVLALNMTDLAQKEGINVNVDLLSKRLGIQIVAISARSNKGLTELKQAISNTTKIATQLKGTDVLALAPEAIQKVKAKIGTENDYFALQVLHQHYNLDHFSEVDHAGFDQIKKATDFETSKLQTEETVARYRDLGKILTGVIEDTGAAKKFAFSDKIDSVLTNRFWGLIIFMGLLFFLFNAIFSWSAYPMEMIEFIFAKLQELGHEYLPAGQLSDLLLDGVLAGLGGIVVFIPQIAILFAFISILEDTGYMARVTFMMDRIMRKFGLSGKSVVPMIGSLACAVPSIMSARNIENWKDRIITIMVAPLVSCSARLPVYTLLISLVVPEKMVWGFINLQGLTLMGMYLISIVAAILVAFVMKFILKAKEKSYFIMEMPVYRMPRWGNVLFTMYDKSKTFVFEAGKVIIAISIVLWVMATYGPSERFAEIDKKYAAIEAQKDSVQISTLERDKSAERLENSYAGILGHAIEPAIRPLGFDWKIGIALITSFAAREAFVGTMATIYSVEGGDENVMQIRDSMRLAKNPETGLPVFTFATAFSLMLFYAFAMQCMSTVAVVFRETKSWKWPMIQLTYMTVMAYVASLIAYQFLK
ncbi:ferrous iron transport protein B [Pedobacter steynii]|uniref:Ferrous iron transport protein B n=1 Tax=Pedobacter steynii TaxID=430522 RepID=A0A1G9WSA3_9SPHI|nr:ferrous iron transport protein B [Pedobacter steynii]NQX40372.1 ferrous iron transport protein B [Pedobacter steynii]SDM87006.1 ferrous iron transport protein B [Pedobacter steynii]